ncbi:pyruvate dehydrogenase E1 component [Candidatus Pelagibacter sp. IMCC9063]|uniref:pyruvate dehydrogenase (acetyl-transferring), homodimeric type n=1 Tax=Pelagibacter sp. (strain IMCC9063) TaxID=1002672 RepID=UPI0002046658|nr:pyruvate dehydrogenase (acetyl-transferring), homodimeric type [Candidatus Pelagibacter sp. IMCC9063]AEA80729.1 pyruvate dehydrogenase E1 component [Candidatus Pelagibacter sp. IMCC9063]
MSSDIKNFSKNSISKMDPQEIEEWIQSLEGVVQREGKEGAKEILEAIEQRAKELRILYEPLPYSLYRNTVALEEQGIYPGDLEIEEKITAILRWNALAMVMRANEKYGEVGGHIASYASCAEIFEVGFNHFFKGGDNADLVFYQPHSSTGVYARAFLEGRLSKEQLENYRHEANGGGLSSYCHPYLMPDFWSFPTGSMGIGPISSIYQARFMRYLENRNLLKTDKHVWGVFGDGEMDEPESQGALSFAAREKLDNLTFIVNCNLQRLDGPVRGNGQIIQELESLFKAAGWNVIKVLWGSEWDRLFALDKKHLLLKRFAETVDGKYQTLGARDGAYNIKNFFGEDPEVMELVSHMSDEDIDALKRGGHDLKKLYAAYNQAINTKGKPSVILAKTKKGYGMGKAGESQMTAHQAKKLDFEALKVFRDKFSLPMNDRDIENLKFYKPEESSQEIQYLKSKRAKLGGFIPQRKFTEVSIKIPPVEKYAQFAFDGSDRLVSTTMNITRLLSGLLRNKEIGPRLVPIVADEARTFGMANLFQQVGIYSPEGQLYEPEDASTIMSYKESTDGQLLEEGINEAGALSSWVAAATSYSNHSFPMLPFYIFYSMFGFQRVGDLIWAAADQMPRGFLIGATAGKTTLSGEGLQHQDGSSQIIASTVPNLKSYDPCFAYELATIFDYGARRMMEECKNEFYYITVGNEKYANPKAPKNIQKQIIQGGYLFEKNDGEININLLGSGPILRESIEAAKILKEEFNIGSHVYSITSFTELSKQAREVERSNRLTAIEKKEKSFVQKLINNEDPIIASSDYTRAYPQLISSYLSNSFVALGTDGFGRSDTRKNLRKFFEIDKLQIVIAALDALCDQGKIPKSVLKSALKKYHINANSEHPWNK